MKLFKLKNFTPLLIIFVMVISCNQFFDPIDSDGPTEENPYIYARQFYYSSAVFEINTLVLRKEVLTIELGNGNEEVLEELEYINQRVEKLEQLYELLIGISPGIGPDGPIGFPPGGCLIGNCDSVVINLTNVEAIVNTNGSLIETNNTDIRNSNNETVGGVVDLDEDQYGQTLQIINSDFEGPAIMYSHITIQGIGDITLKTPVVKY